MLKMGKVLKALRESRCMTQSMVAEAAGISYDTYANWERGNRNPSRRNLEILSEFYSVDIEKLYHSIKDIDVNEDDALEKIISASDNSKIES